MKNPSRLLITPLLFAAASSIPAEAPFEKSVGKGAKIVLQMQESAAPAGNAGRPQFHYELLKKKGAQSVPIWQRDLPRYALDATALGGFHFFDSMQTVDGWFVCYKADRKTFVELAKPESPKNPGSELYFDHHGSARVVTQAGFSVTNGVPLIRLKLKNGNTRAWTYERGDWARAEKYDFTPPPWTRPVDTNAPGLTVTKKAQVPAQPRQQPQN